MPKQLGNHNSADWIGFKPILFFLSPEMHIMVLLKGKVAHARNFIVIYESV